MTIKVIYTPPTPHSEDPGKYGEGVIVENENVAF